MATRLKWSTILMDKGIIGWLAVFLLGVGAADYFLFRRTPSTSNVKSASQGYTHLRCAGCGNQVPFHHEGIGTTCDACGQGGAYSPYTDPLGPNGGRQAGKIGAFVMIAFVLFLSMSHLIVQRIRTLRRMAEEERGQELISQCPFCERKVKYLLARAGTAWVCIQCKTAFLLPSIG